jgi:hypothetical protein
MTSGNYHVRQYGGTKNTGIGAINNNYGASDPQAALRELINAAHALRAQVSPADRQALDESLATIGTGADVEPQPLRGALRKLAGVATLVGQVGVPVVEAVRKVLTAFGLN